jgi:Na+/H+ antiporter NhaD/arsenite permease-like protein
MATSSVKVKQKHTKKTPDEIEEIRKQKDAVTFKVLLVIVAAIISVFVLQILKNLFNHAATSWGTFYFFCGIGVLGGALTVVGIVIIISNILRSGVIKGLPLKLIVSGVILAISGWLVYKQGCLRF